MSRTVMCSRYKEELPGLEAAPFPGPKGQVVFDSVSIKAWEEWQTHQTMLINEKHLNMMDKASRKYLNEQRDKFLVGDAIDHAEGYVPEEK
jgi:Fe-S cluster biosynthesis and repair protein YggX